jgi:hypothetical protein
MNEMEGWELRVRVGITETERMEERALETAFVLRGVAGTRCI